jgi:hypothetical protein
VHIHRIWIGTQETSESALLAKLAVAAGGYLLDDSGAPQPLALMDWIARVQQLRKTPGSPSESGVPSFITRYLKP